MGSVLVCQAIITRPILGPQTTSALENHYMKPGPQAPYSQWSCTVVDLPKGSKYVDSHCRTISEADLSCSER